MPRRGGGSSSVSGPTGSPTRTSASSPRHLDIDNDIEDRFFLRLLLFLLRSFIYWLVVSAAAECLDRWVAVWVRLYFLSRLFVLTTNDLDV